MTTMPSTAPRAPLARIVALTVFAAACAAPESPVIESDAETRTFELAAETFFLAEVDQIANDFAVTVTGPDGDVLREVDGRTGGIETVWFETDAAGAYEVAISANDDQAGQFTFTVLRSEPVATDPVARLGQLLSPWDGDDRAGAIAAVVDGGQMAHVHTVGMANLSHGVPWQRGTVSNIGSVTKQFTAMGLLLLEARGEISLDDDIRTHFPELPDFGEPITPRQLLNHTSGYREIYNLMRIDGYGGEDTFAREHAITVVQRQPELQNRPHTEWNYNNTGYILLSLLVERVTGESFADYMRDNVFEPVGMMDTRMKMVQGELIPRSAQGYEPVETGGFRTTRDLPASAGAGGVYTTVDDLHRWLLNFADPAVGGPGAIEAMATTAVLESGDSTGYGLGLGLGEMGGRTVYSHTGGDVAHRAYLGYLPELESGVILMSNHAGFDLGLGPRVARLFFGDQMEPEDDAEGGEGADGAGAEGEMSDERKEAIAGDWALEVQGLTIPMTVFVDDGEVYIDFTGQERTVAQATSDSTLTIAAADATFTFRADPDGSITTGVASQGGIEMTMRRRAEQDAPTAADLQRYAGRYFSEELEATMHVTVEDGGLVLHQLGQTPQSLTHVSGEHFSAEVFHLNEIAFQRAAGAVTGFTVSNGRTRGVLFRKM